jgi:hypothetical protein
MNDDSWVISTQGIYLLGRKKTDMVASLFNFGR